MDLVTGNIRSRISGAVADKVIHTGGKVKDRLTPRSKKKMQHDNVEEGLGTIAVQAGRSMLASRAGQRAAASRVGQMVSRTRAAYQRNPAAFRRLAKMKIKAAPGALHRKYRVGKVAVKRSAVGMKVRGANRKVMGTLNRRRAAKETARAALRKTNPVRAGINDTTRAISRDIATGVATDTGVRVAMHHVQKKLPQESFTEIIRNHLWEANSNFTPAQMGAAMKKYAASKNTRPARKTQFGSHHIDNAHVAHLRSGHMSGKSHNAQSFKINQKTKTNVSDSVKEMAATIYEDQVVNEWAPLAIGAARMIGTSVATDAVIKGGSKVANKLKRKPRVRRIGEGWDAFDLRGHKTLGKPQRAMGGVKAGLAIGGTLLASRYAGKKVAGALMKRDKKLAANAEKNHASNVKRIAKKIKDNPDQPIRNRIRMKGLKTSAKYRDYSSKMLGKAQKRLDRKAAKAARKNEKLKKRLAKLGA
jgi:hypothetical protein